MVKTLKTIKPQKFQSAAKACQAIKEIYDAQIKFLFKEFENFSSNKPMKEKVSGFYPYIRIEVTKDAFNKERADKKHSYGFVSKAGVYETTVTRPDIFNHYYLEQLSLLIRNHGCDIEIGVSDTPIPIHFALGEDFHLEGDLTQDDLNQIPQIFDVPDLEVMDDRIANATFIVSEGKASPLSLFTAPRTDLSLMRLKHYTGTNSKDFQNYVIFTNYQFYMDEFIKIGEKKVGKDGYTKFVVPNKKGRTPQMPAYHLKRKDGMGITMINIGVGPSNAKNISDHVAVLRPHTWLMLGHCAGLRNSQELGDYVLAHGYLREDNVLFHDLHPSIPLPALSEIQLALEDAVQEVTKLEGHDVKKVMRTGTVATVDDRNWELRASLRQNQRFSQSRAIALDMESGTIAANGFRFRVPYGSLLCVSDKPLHGQLKLPGMADSFYRKRVNQHLEVGLRAMEILREIGTEKLHSRKLRSFNEVAFQ